MPRRAKSCRSNFRFCPILSTLASSSSGLSAASAAPSMPPGVVRRGGGAAVAAAAALPGGERQIAGFVRSERERDPAQDRLHRIEAGGFGHQSELPEIASARDPRIETIDAAHGFV